MSIKKVVISRTFQVHASEISSHWQLSWGEVRDASGVQTRRSHADNSLLEIQYMGTLEELAGRISQIQSSVLEITSFQAQTLDIIMNQ